jgi:hypothetical protein
MLPPLVPEDYACAECDLAYPALSVEAVQERLTAIPARMAEALATVADDTRRRRPDPSTWSAAEYLCHVRDVYLTFTIRLHRVQVEDRPALEPMYNDLRAKRFGYNQCDLDAVLAEIEAGVAGLGHEMTNVRAGGWDRTATRLPGEVRTARWLVRQALHEGTHHAHDIVRPGST